MHAPWFQRAHRVVLLAPLLLGASMAVAAEPDALEPVDGTAPPIVLKAADPTNMQSAASAESALPAVVKPAATALVEPHPTSAVSPNSSPAAEPNLTTVEAANSAPAVEPSLITVAAPNLAPVKETHPIAQAPDIATAAEPDNSAAAVPKPATPAAPKLIPVAEPMPGTRAEPTTKPKSASPAVSTVAMTVEQRRPPTADHKSDAAKKPVSDKKAPAESSSTKLVVEQNAGRQSLALEAGSGRVLTLPGPAANVFVADPRVAEVRPASISSLFVFGVGPGRTTVAVMDNEGHAISQIEVTVRPNTFVAGEAEAAVAKVLHNSRVRVTALARGLLLTGTVGSPADAARAVSIAKGYVQVNDTVDNQMAVESSIQVNLRVRIIEMNRSVTRSLGINWSAAGSLGRFGVLATSVPGLSGGANPIGSLTAGTKDVTSLLQALAADNLVRILAEPNLTVMSGQAGSFLAGGEFPVPVGQQNGTISIDFKRYGVTLGVVPTVLSDGRINLHVNPEVSQLTNQGAVTLTAANTTLSVPALTVRRAETSVELGSGQSFAIAGLLQDQSTQEVNGIPFLGDVPVLGALFRSTSFQRQETELVILVTPYVVNPVSDQANNHSPDEKFTQPSDFEQILLLRQVGSQSGINQTGATASRIHIPGAAGFIVQ